MLNGLEWYKHIQKISGQQINAQLYSSCDANIQNSIVSTVSVFFFYSLKMSYLMQLKELLPNKVILVLIASHSAPLFSHHMKQLLLSWSL